MSRVLVTGAAGFIGSHLTEALLRQGWLVRAVDAFTDTYHPRDKRANLAAVLQSPGFELVADDLLVADVERLLDGVDAIAHLAGEPGVATSWGSSFGTYVQRNVMATQRLLEAATARSVRRFVYASSSSVYAPSAHAVTESAALRPISPYGASKLAGECLVGAYADQMGVPAVSLRYFSVYGPRQRPDMAAHRFIEAALHGRVLAVYGDGRQARDFTYVDDVVAATCSALTADLPPGTVLNVAHGAPVDVATMIALLSELVGAEVAVRRGPHRAGDTPRTDGSNERARAVLGWQPATDLRDGLRRQVEWHLARRARAASAGEQRLEPAAAPPERPLAPPRAPLAAVAQ